MQICDDTQATRHPRIWRAREVRLEHAELMAVLAALDEAMVANDVPAIRRLLQQAVQGYQPSGDVVDWLHTSPGEGEAPRPAAV